MRRFKATVSCKTGTRYRDRLGVILSREPGTRHRNVLRQLCHENLAHGTETFERKHCHVNLAHGTQTFQGSCFVLTWHTAHSHFRTIVSRKPGTRHTDVLGHLCLESLARGAETF